MRRIICLLGVVLVCFMLACPAFAADTFVPSISYKDGPEIEGADLEGEAVGGCVVVTSITEAEEKTTDIYQEDRDLLLDVYKQLSDGSMKLPLENEDYVIRELVDVSFLKTTCVENPEHNHKEKLAEEGVTITIEFDLGVAATTEVVVMTYIDGEWAPIESVQNNGDGTVTCVFEDICPVAFCVEAGAEDAPAQTGDTAGQNLIFWVFLTVVSFATIVALMVHRRKFVR